VVAGWTTCFSVLKLHFVHIMYLYVLYDSQNRQWWGLLFTFVRQSSGLKHHKRCVFNGHLYYRGALAGFQHTITYIIHYYYIQFAFMAVVGELRTDNKNQCIITFMIVRPCHIYEWRLSHWTRYIPSTGHIELHRSDCSIAAASNSSIIHINCSSLVRKGMLQKL
jgi:hypothetical protein